MSPVGTSVYHVEINNFEIFHQYLISPETNFEREHLDRRRVRTRPNIEVGNCQIQLAQQWALFPLGIQATISETTLKLTIVKGSPDRPVVFCKN